MSVINIKNLNSNNNQLIICFLILFSMKLKTLKIRTFYYM